ncbi:MAG: DUF4364 family protein [Clostridia bacterium]|nr:DUF4364 family protein [Clostridia bacterium]
MAFFPEGQGRVKLLMLYIIKRFRTPISREQLYTAMAEVDDATFFEASEILAELEKEMYLIAVPARDQHLLYLTERGEELLSTFEMELPRSVRDEMAGYADEHREGIRRSNNIFCDALPRPDGSWQVELALLENGSTLFEIDLHMPDARTANRARENWLRGADSIYLEILTRLSSENGAE